MRIRSIFRAFYRIFPYCWFVFAKMKNRCNLLIHNYYYGCSTSVLAYAMESTKYWKTFHATHFPHSSGKFGILSCSLKLWYSFDFMSSLSFRLLPLTRSNLNWLYFFISFTEHSCGFYVFVVLEKFGGNTNQLCVQNHR